VKQFDLTKALNDEPVTTQDGRKVSNIRVANASAPKSATEASSLDYDVEHNAFQQGLIVTIHNTSGESDYHYYHDGGSHLYGGKTDADLQMVTQE
jgi:hypothetical protein